MLYTCIMWCIEFIVKYVQLSNPYIYACDIIPFRLEADKSDESREALRNLVLLVSSLSYCGYMELKPSSGSVGSLFPIPGFSFPIPSGRGESPCVDVACAKLLGDILVDSHLSMHQTAV